MRRQFAPLSAVPERWFTGRRGRGGGPPTEPPSALAHRAENGERTLVLCVKYCIVGQLGQSSTKLTRSETRGIVVIHAMRSLDKFREKNKLLPPRIESAGALLDYATETKGASQSHGINFLHIVVSRKVKPGATFGVQNRCPLLLSDLPHRCRLQDARHKTQTRVYLVPLFSFRGSIGSGAPVCLFVHENEEDLRLASIVSGA